MTGPGIRIGVPAYFSPRYSSDDWTEMPGAGEGTLVVVNPASGPARGMRAEYRRQTRHAQHCGVSVYGYVDVAYGRRSRRDILRDIGAYAVALGVDGVLLDQAPADRDALQRLARLMWPVRTTGLRVAINPGQPQIADVAFTRFDEVVVFEGDWDAYQRADNDCRTPVPGGADRWHLVYDVPPERLVDVVKRARGLGAALVYATEKTLPNPWDGLPCGWAAMVDAIDRGRRLSAGARSTLSPVI